MTSYYCSHCGKRNHVEGAEVLVQTPEIPPPHEHTWFKAMTIQNPHMEIYDCACGQRKRVTHEPTGLEEVQDDSRYPMGSTHRALYVR